MPAPQLSVIVPVRNGAGSLPALLAALDRQTLDRDRFEVIVADNASSDETAAIAEAGGARVVREAEDGHPRSRPRNLGAGVATGARFVFTDVDCAPAHGWLEALAGAVDEAPLVAGAVVITTSESPGLVERFERHWRFGQEAWVKMGWAATANLMVAREAFEAIGGFEESYRHSGEDADFCVRAARAGFGLAYCGAAVVTHEAEAEAWPMFLRFFRYGFGSTQAARRIGVGRRSWRHPRPLVQRDAAFERVGIDGEALAPAERRRMAMMSRAAYAMNMAGSAWCELSRAR